MEHNTYKELISSYHDGELSPEQQADVLAHIRDCPECRKEYEEMSRFEEVMSAMELKKPSKEIWQVYWSGVYNRLERRIGWILLSIGGMILLFFGGYKLVENILQDPSISWFLKAGILTFLAGMVILLVSLAREQLFVRKRERYKEIEQ